MNRDAFGCKASRDLNCDTESNLSAAARTISPAADCANISKQSLSGSCKIMNEFRRHLWRVEYDYVFESSHGMQGYSVPHQNQIAHVVTATADVPSVENEIHRAIGNQSRVTKIRTALYLGTLLNANGCE